MPELEQKQFQKRNVACKVLISSILNGEFGKDELSAGYIKIDGTNISRVNIMASLVYKSEDSYSSAIIDDGSGRISLKSFETSSFFANVDIGDAILVIGKVRDFGNERYILPEIVKKIDRGWMNARKSELDGFEEKRVADPTDNSKNKDVVAKKEVYELIKRLDYGDGVAIEDLIKNLDGQDAEKIVNNLLEDGDVFEIKPGKIKILE